MRLLIVEDDPFIALELEHDLTAAGHQVVGIAPSLAAALRLTDHEAPDLALVDVFLGREPDGLVVADELVRRGILVVYVTGSAERVPEDLGGAVGLVEKPYVINELLDVVGFVIQAATEGAPPPPVPRSLRLSPALRPADNGLYRLRPPAE